MLEAKQKERQHVRSQLRKYEYVYSLEVVSRETQR